MRVIFYFNTIVALVSYFVYDFNVEPVILCILYSYVTSLVSDKIIQGGEQALKIEMISSIRRRSPKC